MLDQIKKTIKIKTQPLRENITFKDVVLAITSLLVLYLVIKEIKTEGESDISESIQVQTLSNWNDPIKCENDLILSHAFSYQIFPEHREFLKVQTEYDFDSEYWNGDRNSNETLFHSKYAHQAVTVTNEIVCKNEEACDCINGKSKIVDGICSCEVCNEGFDTKTVGHAWNRSVLSRGPNR